MTMIISYDPNLRLNLWESKDQARETIISMLEFTDVLKISEEELDLITKESDIDKGVLALKKYNIPLIFITLGSEGSIVIAEEKHQHVPAYKVQTIDTTGAGDAFVSGSLYQLQQMKDNIKSITLEKGIEIARFASISGALATSTKGAMTALPSLEKVEDIMEKLAKKKKDYSF